MPRKRLIYTNEFPYHVWARSNNRDWFYAPQDAMWEIFKDQLNQRIRTHKFQVHAFVLMNNHYHMICSTDQEFDLGVVMQALQKSVSRSVNALTGRINHVFGGPYKASLVCSEDYYFNLFKYVYRNPVQANICNQAMDYTYSTLARPDDIALSSPLSGIASMLPWPEDIPSWLDQSEPPEVTESIRRGLKKTVYRPVFGRGY